MLGQAWGHLSRGSTLLIQATQLKGPVLHLSPHLTPQMGSVTPAKEMAGVHSFQSLIDLKTPSSANAGSELVSSLRWL